MQRNPFAIHSESYLSLLPRGPVYSRLPGAHSLLYRSLTSATFLPRFESTPLQADNSPSPKNVKEFALVSFTSVRYGVPRGENETLHLQTYKSNLHAPFIFRKPGPGIHREISWIRRFKKRAAEKEP